MKATAVKSIRDQARFQPGDDVGLLLGPRYVHGTVVEDRGFIASGGRQMLMIRVNLGQDVEFEMPGDLLEKFPADDPDVRSAFENVKEAIQGYQGALRPDEQTDPRRWRNLRSEVKTAYRALPRALKESAPSASLEALEASIPPGLARDARVALQNQTLPSIKGV